MFPFQGTGDVGGVYTVQRTKLKLFCINPPFGTVRWVPFHSLAFPVETPWRWDELPFLLHSVSPAPEKYKFIILNEGIYFLLKFEASTTFPF